MAKIFLDTNYFFDVTHRSPEKLQIELLESNSLYISALSVHIYCYIYKIKISNDKVSSQIEKFQIIDLSEAIVQKALKGGGSDFEDNVQLHSAVEAECDIFLTNNQKLLDLNFFGKMVISSEINQ